MTEHPNTQPDDVPGPTAGSGEGGSGAGNQAEQADETAQTEGDRYPPVEASRSRVRVPGFPHWGADRPYIW